jgi:hypothetical protein
VFCSETGGLLDERSVTPLVASGATQGAGPGRPAAAASRRSPHLREPRARAGKSVRWVAAQLGHANPELTLRVYAHALREEESDLSFLDFGGTKRHPRGTAIGTAAGITKPPRANTRRGL